MKRLEAWKASIPFDHVSTISCVGKNFVMASVNRYIIEKYLHSYDNYVLYTESLIIKNGGKILPNVTRTCDYLVVGMDATVETSKVVQAIRYRDSGKSNIKIIPEDEIVRILNGEVLEISEEDQKAMWTRQETLKNAEEEKQQALLRKRQLAEEEKQRKAEETRAARQIRQQAKQLAAAEVAEQQRQERMKVREIVQQQKAAVLAAEKAAKAEQRRLQEEERAKTMFDHVVCMPGEEPANIRARMDRLFVKLDEAYPDKQIIGLQKDHKKWAETVTELYRLLGYPDNRAFLEAYGYTVVQGENKGGRPTNDHTAVIEELKRRYPNGGCKNVSEIQRANSDLPIKTLVNNAQKLFGKSLKDYLQEIGVL